MFSGGTGAWNDPYLISTVEDFKLIDGYYAHYKQVAHLDFSGVSFNEIPEFHGVYNGDNFEIRNLETTSIFKELVSYSELSNIRLVNSECLLVHTVRGGAEIHQCSAVGGAGMFVYKTTNYCRISECFQTDRYIPDKYIERGGFLGRVEGGTISDCYVRNITFDKNSPQRRLGGFAGEIMGEYSSISNCYADNFKINNYRYAGPGQVNPGSLMPSITNDISGFVGATYGGSVNGCFASNAELTARGIVTFDRSGKALGSLMGLHGFAGGSQWNIPVTSGPYDRYVNNSATYNIKAIQLEFDIPIDEFDGYGNPKTYYTGRTSSFLGDATIINGSNPFITFLNSCYVDTELITFLPSSTNDEEMLNTELSSNIWNTSASVFGGKPYIRRFWEGNGVVGNPWRVDENINGGMPYLKRDFVDPETNQNGNMFVKTASGWKKAQSIYIKTSTGWKKAKDTIKAKTPTGWK